MLNGYVYVDVAGRDVGSYVAAAELAVRKDVALPAGYTLAWSGQYEAMERLRKRLKFVLPLTLFLIFLLLYLNTRSTTKTMIVLLAVPFSGIGAIDRKSTRLNSSHANISYAVFCLKKKK